VRSTVTTGPLGPVNTIQKNNPEFHTKNVKTTKPSAYQENVCKEAFEKTERRIWDKLDESTNET